MKGMTKAQQRELSDLAKLDSRAHYSSEYKPIVRLLELGYVDKQEGKYGSPSFAITPAGRLALSSNTRSGE